MTHKVTELHGEPTPFQTKAGHNLVGYWLSLEGVSERVNWNRPPDQPAPEVGKEYDLDLEAKENSNGKYFKATKANHPQGNWAGGGGMSPEREKRIVRQHSQTAAVALMREARERGISVNEALAQMKVVADKLDEDAGV